MEGNMSEYEERFGSGNMRGRHAGFEPLPGDGVDEVLRKRARDRAAMVLRGRHEGEYAEIYASELEAIVKKDEMLRAAVKGSGEDG